MKHISGVVVSIATAFAPAEAARSKLEARATALVMDLAKASSVDPHAAAKRLGVEILSIDQVSPYRREYQLAPSALFHDVTAIVGGKDDAWRVIDLVPRGDFQIAPVMTLLADAPYEPRPFMKHLPDGPVIAAIDHHFAVTAGELIIRTAPRSARIEIITLTTTRTVSPTAPSLRSQR